ncbi:hypothetical protein [Streptomyces virginiae]|uniref:hypothetical protein n=1 Tax=Streptomyces virginiae TaxID=1961 RepID=UPI0036468AEF
MRFHLGCLAALIPYHQRPAALEAWLDLDRALFHLGFHAPSPVTDPPSCAWAAPGCGPPSRAPSATRTSSGP